ncbi:nucleoid-associated protein [Alcaligenes phenolicus]
MPITVNNAIVHELIKESNQTLDPSLQIIKDTPLDPTLNTVINLITKIHDVYGSRENTCEYGIFLNNGRQGRFPSSFDGYVSTNSASFHELSVSAMDEIIRQAAITDWATGGYIVCSDYSEAGRSYVVIAMIKKTNEMRFNSDLAPEEIIALNLKKLHQAIRINKERYTTRPVPPADITDYNYLSFLGETQRGASHYFVNALGCDKGKSSRKATDTAYKYIQEKFSSNENLRREVLKAKETLTTFFDEKISNNSPVLLTDIAAILQGAFSSRFSDPNESEVFFNSFISEMNGDRYEIPRVFNAHASAVKAHKQVKYKSNSMSLSIETSAIDLSNSTSDVYWDNANGKLTITADSRLKREIQQKVYGPEL